MTTVDSVSTGYCPECLHTLYQSGVQAVESVQNQIEDAIKAITPKEMHKLCLGLLRTLPESLMCIGVVLGKVSYGHYIINFPKVSKIIWTLISIRSAMPFMAALVSGPYDRETFGKAWNAVIQNYVEEYSRLRPALVLTALVVCVFYCYLWVTLSSEYGLKSILVWAVAKMGLNSLERDPIAKPSFMAVDTQATEIQTV